MIYCNMSEEKDGLKSIKVYKFNNMKESWHEFALKFRVIADDRGYDDIIDMIFIKTQVFRLLRYCSPAPRNIARSDWATQNITHNMTSSIT